MRKVLVIMGSCFLLVSGMLYAVERILGFWRWSVEYHQVASLGGNPANPSDYVPSLTSDWFVPVFLVLGIAMLVSSVFSKH
jgi:hypothetical protein